SGLDAVPESGGPSAGLLRTRMHSLIGREAQHEAVVLLDRLPQQVRERHDGPAHDAAAPAAAGAVGRTTACASPVPLASDDVAWADGARRTSRTSSSRKSRSPMRRAGSPPATTAPRTTPVSIGSTVTDSPSLPRAVNSIE